VRQFSTKVLTNQPGINPRIGQIIERNLRAKSQYLISSNVLEICQKIKLEQKEGTPKIILDSGCGTGDSTLNISEIYNDYLVIGVDKSPKRLNQALKKTRPANVRFFRANLVEFWYGLISTDVTIEANFIFYPNPWPKEKHLKKRWHCHPIMVLLPELSNYIELRTNWYIYADEFRTCLTKITNSPIKLERIYPTKPISGFEKKYLESKHELFRSTYGNLMRAL